MNAVHPIQQSHRFPLGHTCADCASHDWCLPAGLDATEMKLLDQLNVHIRVVTRGGSVYRAGTTLHSLYAICRGFVKCTITQADGRGRVTGLHMPGELIGMDAINSGRYLCDAVALEESTVCAIPFGELERLTRDIPTLQQYLHRTLGREIARDYRVMLLLGCMCAEERIAAFLVSLSKRYAVRGYSATRINLRLTREEIGSYLGLKLETVSRVFSRFQAERLIAVQGKDIEIKDLEGLNRMASKHRGTHPRASRRALRGVSAVPPVQLSLQCAQPVVIATGGRQSLLPAAAGR